MASSPSAPKYPWYLFAALIAGWLYGAGALSEGWDTISYYHDEKVDVRERAEAITDGSLREAVVAAGEHWLALRDAAKTRELPIGIASFLLGGAMILLSARSMSAREGARHALIQVVLVHAVLVVGAFFLTADVTRGFVEYQQRTNEATLRTLPQAPPLWFESFLGAIVRDGPPLHTLFQTLASGLIVFALTRPRARAFFRAAPEQLEG